MSNEPIDMAETIQANSEQVNADDLLSGSRIVTITGVESGTAEQPVFIHLAEFPERTYRPAKSMRRVLVACWGPDAAAYIGRHMELYTDPTVKWGGQAVGGIRIAALSHIDKPVTVALTVSRGKRAPFVVKPLEVAQKPAQAPAWVDEVAAADDMAALSEIHARAVAEEWVTPELIAALKARKAELGGN